MEYLCFLELLIQKYNKNIIYNTDVGFLKQRYIFASRNGIYNNTVVNSSSPYYGNIHIKIINTGPVTYYNNIIYGGRSSVYFDGVGYTNPVFFHHNNHYGYTSAGWYLTYTSQTFSQWQAGVVAEMSVHTFKPHVP